MAEIEIPKSGESDENRDRFNNLIAIAVAIVSAFMAVSKIKDDNIVQGMQKAQAEMVDSWNEYQARRQRWFGLEVAIAQTKATNPMTPELEKTLADWKKNADTYQSRAEESATKAKARAAEFAEAGARDDLFDLSDAFLSVAIALFAVTALVRIRWLFGAATVLGVIGMVFGVGGFAGWTDLTPTFLIALLT